MSDVLLRPFATNPYDIILYDTSLLPAEYPILIVLVPEPIPGLPHRLLVRRRVFGSARYEEVWGDAPPIAYIVYKGKGKE